ncbi:hypothetical protein EXU48_11410 [Occultella glacieicola]|uniref:Capsular polysaccharide biosynthesis protein n=1 Tax=Occultella glacieicola TaxID=2518684 RepID=A0ABY2E6W9_9MICO|nr:hypothetical protein [Occultella glacieicola]TDE94056.1 hypothetical protein EXU48_11410 [Occultella glacieicola]
MDVWSITVAALRRWYILLPLLALSGAAAYAVGERVQPEYNIAASAIVVPGRAVAEIANPYGGLDDANSVLGIVLNGTETQAEVAAAGLVPTYTVAPTTRSTVLNFEVRADTPEAGVATGEMVFELAREELTTRQTNAGLPPATQYGLDVLQEPAVTAVVADGKTRNMAIVGVLGAALSLLIAVLFDDLIGLIKRARAHRQERRAASESEAVEPGLDPDDGRPDDLAPDEGRGEHVDMLFGSRNDGTPPVQDDANQSESPMINSSGRRAEMVAGSSRPR